MKNTTPNPEPAPDELRGLTGFFGKFTVLKTGMRELWLVFIIKLLVIAAYGLMNSTLVLWLESDFHYSDRGALGMVGAWSLTMSIFTVLVGSLTDTIGLRKTFFWGVGLCIVSRGVMAFTTHKWLALAGGLFPLAIGEALTGPVLVSAVQQYSNTKQRSISFSLIYTMMNVGFLIGSLLFDDVRTALGEEGHLNVLGLHLSTYRILLLVSGVINCAIVPFLFWLREGASATDEGVKVTPRKKLHQNEKLLPSIGLTVRDTARDTLGVFTKLLQQKGFYRLLLFLFLIAFLKLIFMQMYYVFPEFGIRVLGKGAKVGTLWAINSIIVIFLVPVVGALTQKFSAYKMVILGGLITAASVFIMALPPALFAPIANGPFGHWLGHSYLNLKGSMEPNFVLNPYYVMIAIFVVMLSFGEAFYSPRVYEYAAAIAPKGQEASYGALSYVPLMVAKIMIGGFSGTLLATYCPEKGTRHPEIMWLFVALTGCIAPIGLVLLRRFIRLKEAGRED